MNLFEAVKQSVTTRQAAEHYGIHIGRNGMACCPFHHDKTPSMKLDRRYHCFGCGADGDVIDFTAALYGLGKKEAAVQLAQDFGFSYEDWKPPGKAKKPKPRQKSPEEQFQEAKSRCFRILADYLHLLRAWRKEYANGKEVDIKNPMDAVKHGIGYLSEDRKRYGIVVGKSVAENSTMATMDQFMSGAFINKKKERAIAQKYVDSLKTKTPNVDQLVVNLSGGNQQKVVIAKWLVRNCDILIFDEPTRGIDVGAKSEIYHLMNELVAAGKSIIMISSEMTEILRMSDRIIVMCEGRVTGEIGIEEATQERIMHAATLRK